MPLLHAALGWNYVLVTALCGSFLAQFIKVILNLFIFHRFIPERMWGAGGMPSSHSATVCAMVVATGRYCGVTSTQFRPCGGRVHHRYVRCHGCALRNGRAGQTAEPDV